MLASVNEMFNRLVTLGMHHHSIFLDFFGSKPHSPSSFAVHVTLFLKRQLYDLARDEIRTHYDESGVQVKPWMTIDDIHVEAIGVSDALLVSPLQTGDLATDHQLTASMPQQMSAPSTHIADISYAALSIPPTIQGTRASQETPSRIASPRLLASPAGNRLAAAQSELPTQFALTMPPPTHAAPQVTVARSQLLATFLDPNAGPEETVLALTRKEGILRSPLSAPLGQGAGQKRLRGEERANPQGDEDFVCLDVNGTIIGGNRQKLAARLRSYASASSASSAHSSGKLGPEYGEIDDVHVPPLDLSSPRSASVEPKMRRSLRFSESPMLAPNSGSAVHSGSALPSDQPLLSDQSLFSVGHVRMLGRRTQSYVADGRKHSFIRVDRMQSYGPQTTALDTDILRDIDASKPIDTAEADLNTHAGETIHPYLDVDVGAEWVKQAEAQRQQRRKAREQQDRFRLDREGTSLEEMRPVGPHVETGVDGLRNSRMSVGGLIAGKPRSEVQDKDEVVEVLTYSENRDSRISTRPLPTSPILRTADPSGVRVANDAIGHAAEAAVEVEMRNSTSHSVVDIGRNSLSIADALMHQASREGMMQEQRRVGDTRDVEPVANVGMGSRTVAGERTLWTGAKKIQAGLKRALESSLDAVTVNTRSIAYVHLHTCIISVLIATHISDQTSFLSMSPLILSICCLYFPSPDRAASLAIPFNRSCRRCSPR